jgi:integrase
MNRPRSVANRSLPDNLHRKTDKRNWKVYYSYRDPRTGREHGLGSDYDSATSDAKALNAAIYASIRSIKLAALTENKVETPSINTLAMRHLALCEKRKLAVNTIRTRKSHVGAWVRALGRDTPIGEVMVTDFVRVIREYEENGQNRAALAMRTTAVEMWKDAMAEGWAPDNVPARTRAPVAVVKRSRLTLEAFRAIHQAAATLDPWIQRSMELALVSAQRREDIAAMEFRLGPDGTSWIEDGELRVIQKKTGTKVIIPLDVGIDAWNLSSVVKSCRDNIVSRWLIHHQRPRTKSKPGDQVWIDTITKGFARARDLAGITGEEGKAPPTYHEIRSLAIRLYTEKFGKDFAQAIAGHKDAATTEIYRDVRGDEWVSVRPVRTMASSG